MNVPDTCIHAHTHPSARLIGKQRLDIQKDEGGLFYYYINGGIRYGSAQIQQHL